MKLLLLTLLFSFTVFAETDYWKFIHPKDREKVTGFAPNKILFKDHRPLTVVEYISLYSGKMTKTETNQEPTLMKAMSLSMSSLLTPRPIDMIYTRIDTDPITYMGTGQIIKNLNQFSELIFENPGNSPVGVGVIPSGEIFTATYKGNWPDIKYVISKIKYDIDLKQNIISDISPAIEGVNQLYEPTFAVKQIGGITKIAFIVQLVQNNIYTYVLKKGRIEGSIFVEEYSYSLSQNELYLDIEFLSNGDLYIAQNTFTNEGTGTSNILKLSPSNTCSVHTKSSVLSSTIFCHLPLSYKASFS